MATQLKDLKFNDYGVKGTVNSNEGADFTLSGSDVIGYMVTGSGGCGSSGPPVFTKIIACDYSTGCSTDWHFYGYADKAGSADSAAHAANASEATSAGVAGSAYALMTEHGSVAPISYTGGCESDWFFDGKVNKASRAGSANSVYDSDGGSALYYNGGWVLNAVAGSANSVYDSNGGSALYYDGGWVLNAPASYFYDGNSYRYDFSDAVSLPELSKSGGSSATLADVESWIEQFRSSVTGYLVTATIQ